MRVIVVAGARPNFMKVAPILRALKEHELEGILVHTGQHYDVRMSDAFFKDLNLPHPNYHLGVGSGTHATQTARVMEAFEPVLLQETPDWLIVVGDVNSTLACALVASKLRDQIGVRIAHVEAGLRSGDWRMPEEVNRVLTDKLADLLLTPSKDATPNLIREGIPEDRIRFIGNVMIDTLLHQLTEARNLAVAQRLGLARREYVVATLHRPSNVDDPESLSAILKALAAVAQRMPVVFPIHPRTLNSIKAFGLTSELEQLTSMDPISYRKMLSLIDGAAVVMTDSGGLQEETTALGVPCVTLREQTERPITVTEGTNRLVEWPLSEKGVLRGFEQALADLRHYGHRTPVLAGWDGLASERLVEALVSYQ